MRAAVYYTPEPDDPLWLAGVAWHGRDPQAGADCRQPPYPVIAAATASPARYGFHATLKAPIEPAFGLDPLLTDAWALARSISAFALPPLAVRRIDGFIALGTVDNSPPLQALADACVTGLDRHRRPESPERQARRAVGLDAGERAHLARWGYPYVLDRWRFHMTLTGRLEIPHPLESAARDWFADALTQPRRVTSLAVFVEPADGAPFGCLARFPLGDA